MDRHGEGAQRCQVVQKGLTPAPGVPAAVQRRRKNVEGWQTAPVLQAEYGVTPGVALYGLVGVDRPSLCPFECSW